MRLIKAKFPDLLLCIATNGLYLEPYAKEIAQIGVSHVTVTVNAVDPKIGAKIYSWVRYQKLMYRGEEGAALLLEKQLSAIRKMKELDIVVKVNTVIIPGINDLHIEEIAKTMAGLKVDILNCIPIYPSPDSEFQDMEQPDEKMIASVRAKAALHLPQMTHCKRCRADAVGLLGETMTNEAVELLRDCSQLSDEASDDRPYVAVGTMEGLLVNAHLGELEYLSIYKEHEDSFVLVEKRKAPPSGSGSKRWEQLGDLLHDCRAILVSGVGESPKKVLLEKGLKVYTVEGLIEDGLDAIYKGNRILQIKPKTKCGESCSGTGLGCG
jgi:nitrogen fixation protein NifB